MTSEWSPRFKVVTEENWLEPDPTTLVFGRYSPEEGKFLPLSAGDWIRAIRAPRLGADVSDDLRRLFEAARNMMIYGYLWYPLFTLADQQLYRVLESALRIRCQSFGASAKIGFEKAVKMLHQKGLITAQQVSHLDTIRSLRNRSSHPDYQSVMSPSTHTLKTVASYINQLFPPKEPEHVMGDSASGTAK